MRSLSILCLFLKKLEFSLSSIPGSVNSLPEMRELHNFWRAFSEQSLALLHCPLVEHLSKTARTQESRLGPC